MGSIDVLGLSASAAPILTVDYLKTAIGLIEVLDLSARAAPPLTGVYPTDPSMYTGYSEDDRRNSDRPILLVVSIVVGWACWDSRQVSKLLIVVLDAIRRGRGNCGEQLDPYTYKLRVICDERKRWQVSSSRDRCYSRGNRWGTFKVSFVRYVIDSSPMLSSRQQIVANHSH
jgi:hypothetical protein